MKIRLLTSLIISACFSHAASAAELTTGSITNQTTATADVVFNQPVTLVNTLTPHTGLISGKDVDNKGIILATGSLSIVEAGVNARLAMMVTKSDGTPFTVRASGHEKDNNDEYELKYKVSPSLLETPDSLKTAEGVYSIKKTASNSLNYTIITSMDTTPKPGHYIISATGAVYNP